MPAEESYFRMLKKSRATSVTINEPTLELSKNRFDERVIANAREGLTFPIMHFLPDGCKLYFPVGRNVVAWRLFTRCKMPSLVEANQNFKRVISELRLL